MQSRRISFIIGLGALILGLAGQLLLTAKHIPVGAACYLLALAFLILAFHRWPGPVVGEARPAPSDGIWSSRRKRVPIWAAPGEFEVPRPLEDRAVENRPDENRPILSLGKFRNPVAPILARFMPRGRAGTILLGAALVCALLAFWLFETSVPAVIPWLLYLGSMALLILAASGFDWNRPRGKEVKPPWSRVELAVFFAILAVAAFLRFYRLDQIPYGMFYDEADNGLQALKILQTAGFLPVYISSTNLPADFIYLIVLSFRLLGTSTLALRAVSAVIGLGTVAVAYFAGREMFDRRTGLVLAFFLAVSRWDINWSRIGMHGISVPFFELLSVALLLRALRRRRMLDFTLTGLVVGLGMSFYVPLRFFPLVLGLFVLVFFLTRRDFWRSTWRAWLLLGLAGVIATVPVFQYAVHHPDDFFARTQTTSIFTGKTSQEAWSAVARTTVEHLVMFNYRGDRNGRHNVDEEPMLDPISASLMILGIGLSVWRIRRPGSVLLVAWLFLMLIPAIFSLDFESPQSLRAIGSLPAAYLLSVVPLHVLWQEWEKAAPPKAGYVFQAALFALLVTSGTINYQLYFARQSVSFASWSAFSTPETIIAKIMAQKGSQVDYYVSTFFYQRPTIQFLAPQVTSYHVLQTNETLPVRLDNTRAAILFVDADRRPFYLQAKQYYPGAIFNEIKSPSGETVLFEIELRPEDIASVQGLTASYYPNSKWDDKPALVRKETNFKFDWEDGKPLPFPFGVEWKGILFAHTYGAYQLIIHSPSAVELTIDEKQVALTGEGVKTGEVVLAKGNHTFRLRSEAKAGHFELDWTPPAEKSALIPVSALFLPEIGSHGLLGSYFSNDSWQAPAAFTQIDPWIHFYFHETPLKRPYTVEWVGKISIAQGGTYLFGLESIDESSLFIDENQVVDDRTPNQYQNGKIDLSPGAHSIRIRFSDRTGSTHINVYWMPPGSDLESLPQEVLYPPWAGPEVMAIPAVQATSPAAAPAPVVPGGQAVPFLQVRVLWQIGQCGSLSGQFRSPNGMALDPHGNLWVADTDNSRVVEISPAGKILGTIGSHGDGSGQFQQPFDLAVEPGGGEGSLVVLDSESARVLQRFNLSGQYQAGLGKDLGTYNPRGLGVDGAGSLYIADTGGNRMLQLSSKGDVIGQWQLLPDTSAPGQPVGAVAGPDGEIYTLEMIGKRIWKLLPDGKSLSWAAAISGDTLKGSRIAIGPDHTLYLSDPEHSRLVLYNLDGQIIGQVSGGAGNQKLLEEPVGIVLGPDGVMYITDNARCNVSALKLSGN